jgi:hypothetical protein
MKKIVILLVFIFPYICHAIDLQNKIFNSDKSYFETISTPYILNQKDLSFYTTYSIQKYPVIYNEEPLIDGLQSVNFFLFYMD